jgi:hypothetical protein
MIKKLYTRFKEKRAAKKRAAEVAEANKAKAMTTEYTALYTQTCENILYLNAAINSLNVFLNTMKGKNMTETKNKRSNARSLIEWYARNLEEEKVMREHYASLVGL